MAWLMIRSVPRLALALAALALLVPGAASAQRRAVSADDCIGADLLPTPLTLDIATKATFCLVNVQRTTHGLRALRDNSRIDKAAASHSKDMVARSYFDHVTPAGADPVTRLSRVHYITNSLLSWSIGEDLGWGSGTEATPRAIVQAWMDSPPHRANILRTSFRDAGVGVAYGAPQHVLLPGATYTIDFGRRAT
jgi:uncharacterized protein YkwD